MDGFFFRLEFFGTREVVGSDLQKKIFILIPNFLFYYPDLKNFLPPQMFCISFLITFLTLTNFLQYQNFYTYYFSNIKNFLQKNFLYLRLFRLKKFFLTPNTSPI